MGPRVSGPRAPGPRTARGGLMPGSSPYRVVVIGAGFGGIGMGIALRRAGIEDFLIVDKGEEPGGTWRDNTYPGAACDVPAHLYSFSFRPGRWSGRFPPQREILAYLCDLAEENGLGPHLRLGSGVTRCRFDAGRALWDLTLATGELLTSGFVLSPKLLAGPMQLWRRQLNSQIADPGLRAKCVPGYVMGCKRVLFSNDWYPALARPNVDLVTEPIERIAPGGVVTA